MNPIVEDRDPVYAIQRHRAVLHATDVLHCVLRGDLESAEHHVQQLDAEERKELAVAASIVERMSGLLGRG